MILLSFFFFFVFFIYEVVYEIYSRSYIFFTMLRTQWALKLFSLALQINNIYISHFNDKHENYLFLYSFRFAF